MPVNFTQIQQQIRDKCRQAKGRQQEYLDRLDRARQLLQRHAADLEGLAERVQAAGEQDQRLRCAVPLREPLDSALPAPQVDAYPVLLAADGSQVNPNRHDPVEFAVVNIGLIRIAPGRGETPQETTSTELFLFEDLESSSGPLTEELVALTRDLYERRELAELAAREKDSPLVFTLTDGPLELFREPKGDERFDQRFKDYLDVLEKMASMSVVTAGYVDQPRADLVVRLLELTLFRRDELQRAGKERPLRGVRDQDLYRGLQPGERSAVFAIQSISGKPFRERLDGKLTPCFFYLNTGRVGHPWLARVEIPRWVAERAELVGLLQASLLAQSRQMGSKAYPYALHRAHEVALVTFQEKQQLQTMIENELRRQGVEPGEKSHKQSAKDLEGRRRYGA